jgi:MFS family permease
LYYLQRAEFDWSKSTKSSLLSSFFYGYAITQIPGGWLADRIGGRRVYGTALAISGIATLLMPVGARTNIIMLYVLRIVVGLATVCYITQCYLFMFLDILFYL